ncbi:phage major capsid protein [Periweissella cryptocerci]|uniref:Phage major capsid protein n=1 Tax=Periweissella cryptocerci TaxID=2506420 RepID=A0A4V1AIG1_9LACO|nr:phage major capsid protein [Periweissella cryptocerci]QBO35385.1 phage major capsid protein [Periweissella cryptocerci]
MTVEQQTFNPATVLMHDAKNGYIPNVYSDLVLDDFLHESVVTKLGKFIDMGSDTEKEFQHQLNGPGAYWVAEGQRINTTTSEWATIKMTSHKLATIVPITNEYGKMNQADFFDMMRPQIAAAFYEKFDKAVLLGIDNPFTQSIESIVTDEDNDAVVTTRYANKIDEEDVLALEDLLTDKEIDPNAFISTSKNRSMLRKARNNNGVDSSEVYDRTSKNIDGVATAELSGVERGELYLGDWNNLFYGVPAGIEYKISEEGSLSTVVGSDGQVINLFERDMVAMRVTMYVSMMVLKEDGFAKLEQGTEVAGDDYGKQVVVNVNTGAEEIPAG